MGKIAILFAGQGAQSVGMGKDLYESSANAKRLYDIGEGLRAGTLYTCFEGEGAALTQTQNAQPCLFLTGLAFAEELRNAGIEADAVAGFSLGEIPALAFAGVLSEEAAFKLVSYRGEVMAEISQKHPGGMAAALKLDNAAVEEVCAQFTEVWPVNYNCPGQLACAGNAEQIDEFCNAIKARGGRAVKLAVSGAFHTPYMEDAKNKLKEYLQNIEVNAAYVPVYSNKTGNIYPADREGIVNNVSAQVCSSVRWETIIRDMSERGVDTFIEVGAGKTLTGFVKRILPDAAAYTVTDVASLRETVAALKGE